MTERCHFHELADFDGHNCPDCLRRQLAQAQEENYRLRRVLKEIEWRGHDPNENGDVCPWCGWEKRDGHRPDCELAAVLAATPKTPYEMVVRAACRWREAQKTHLAIPTKSKQFRQTRDAYLQAQLELEKAVDVLMSGPAGRGVL